MPNALKLKVLFVSAIAAFALASVPPVFAGQGEKMAPAERAKSVAKGELKNPLTSTPEIIEEGKSLYQVKTCGACHGANGSGIHCPSVINDAWIYGGDDDTLFRLLSVGSETMFSDGYVRGEREKHAGPMPAFSDTVDEQEMWKIITYIRSLKPGDAGAKE